MSETICSLEDSTSDAIAAETLTAQMLQEPGPVIAMSTEHRLVLAERFNLPDIPLFTEACGIPGESLPDVDEAVRDHTTNPIAVDTHIRMIIDRIIELTPQLASRLLQQEGPLRS